MDNLNSENAGIFFVARKLSKLGLICSTPMFKSDLFDIIAVDKNNIYQYAIKVKTTRDDKKWILSRKDIENTSENNMFYIFVCTSEKEPAEFYIFPREEIHYFIETSRKYITDEERQDKAKFFAVINDENRIYKDFWDFFKND